MRFNRRNSMSDNEPKASVSKKKIKLPITNGSYISIDTKVTINNVMVSFFSLLAAPWCWDCAPQRNLITMDTYDMQMISRQSELNEFHK